MFHGIQNRHRASLAFWQVALGLLVAFCGAYRAIAQNDIVELTVTGQGISEDAAKNDALRKALEQGGRVEISSHSNDADFELIRDSI